MTVIGGGIAGLSTAFALQEQATASGFSLNCVVLEASSRWGGKILTHRVGELVLEAGPDSFLSQKPWALELCGKLGLADQLINTNETGKKAFVFSRGRLRDLPEGLVLFTPRQLGPFIRSGLLSWAGLLRMGLDLALPPRRAASDESLASFFRRRFGREAFERLIEPLMAGIYAGDAERMSLKATFPRFFELEQQHGSLIRGMIAGRKAASQVSSSNRPRRTMFVTLRNGLGDLIASLTGRLQAQGVSLRTGVHVRTLHARSRQEGPSYDLLLDNGDVLTADAVVLATPAYAAAQLVKRLSPVAAGLMEMIPYASTATISLSYETQAVQSCVEGFGFVVPRVEQRDLIAATWTSLKWSCRAQPGETLIRCYVGGVGREEILNSNDDALVGRVRSELAGIVGLQATPRYIEVNRWNNAMPQYTIGHLHRLAEMERALEHCPGLFITGAAYRGVGIPDCIRDGTQTAEKVMRYLVGISH